MNTTDLTDLSVADREALRLFADSTALSYAEQIGRPTLASFPRESDEALLDHAAFWHRVARAVS